jgi:hypothetical protein
MAPSLVPAFGHNDQQLRTDGLIPRWQRAGMIAETTKKTAGMFALEATTR